MSLIAHWPLNGTLEDISGHDNPLLYESSAGGVVVDDNGKTGRCYKRTAKQNEAGYMISSKDVNLPGDFTMACWAYVEETHTGTANGLIGQHNHTDFTGAVITVKSYNALTDYRMSCSTGDGAGRTFHTYFGQKNIANKWCHLVLRYCRETNLLEMFVDGVLDFSISTLLKTKLAPITIFNWSWGARTSTSYKPKSRLNDVRIYDHAISNKELSDIKKAKLLHYDFNYSEEATVNEMGTFAPYTPYHSLIQNGKNFKMVMINGFVAINNGASHPGKKMSMSGYMFKNGAPMFFSGNRPTTYDAAPAEVWKSDPVTGYFEIVCDYIEDVIWLLHCPISAVAGDVVEVFNFQLEEKGAPTAFTFGSRTGRISDKSGFGNHSHELNDINISWVDADTPIGKGAVKFDGAVESRIKFDAVLFGKEEESWTIFSRVWLDDVPNRHQALLVGFNAGCNLTHSTTGKALNYGAGGVNDHYTYSNSITPRGKWISIAFVYNLKKIRCEIYIDGILAGASGNMQATDVPVGFSAIATIGEGLSGMIADLQIFATDLSSEDIKILHEYRGGIVDNGNLVVNKLELDNSFSNHLLEQNLVINGHGEYRDNKNFSQMEYDPSTGGFRITSGSATIKMDGFIEIEGDGLGVFDQYELSADIKGEGVSSTYYFMIICYDKNKNPIDIVDVNHYTNTRTTLTQDLKPGDTEMFLADLTNWHDDGLVVYNHLKTLSMWLTTDDYKEFTRASRNVPIIAVDKVGKKLTAREPYTGVLIPAGSSVCNSAFGSSYGYIGAVNLPTNITDWEHRVATTTATASAGSMRYGTKYIKVGWLINRGGSVATTLVKNVKFKRVGGAQKHCKELQDMSIGPNGVMKANHVSENGITRGLVGWWKLDGDLLDSSGMNDMSPEGISAIIDGKVFQQGYAFKSTAAQNPNFTMGDNPLFTVMGWFRRTGDLGAGGAWGIGGGASLKGISAYSGSGRHIGIDLWGATTYYINKEYPLNEWVHVAWVKRGAYFEESRMEIWVNGVKEGPLVINRKNTIVPSLDNGISIGRIGRDYAGYYSSMDVSSFKVFNVDLLGDEIELEYNLINNQVLSDKNGTIYLRGQVREDV